MLLQRDPVVHHPFAYDIGPLQLTGFGLAVLAGFAIAQIIAQRELTRRGDSVSAAAIPDLVFAAVLGTLIGAKLYYVIVLTHDIRDLFTRAGFVFWGGFIGSVVLCWLTIRKKKLSFTRISDAAGISIAAGYSVGRTGCWAVGDDYGRPWSGPLAVAFPDGAPASTAGNLSRMFGIEVDPSLSPNAVLAVHPTQLYETVLGFVMFAVLWRLRDHRHAAGWLFGLYCVLAGVERFVIEFVRAKDDKFFGPLTVAQAIAIAIALFGAAWMFARRETSPGRGAVQRA